MKRLVIKLLAAVGLAPAGRYAMASRQAHKLGKEARVWKKRAVKSGARATTLEQQLKDQVHRLKEARAAAEQKASLTGRDEAEWKAMQSRLAESERALAIAREQLMAIEVKLDILEGAANVLDARTRSAVQR
ncbi:MAG TPA: hypothetical protein VM846_17875 [Vicinamibacterales bacterium]|nr:hypothetical protein [Vicinamibacterales bacterium]